MQDSLVEYGFAPSTFILLTQLQLAALSSKSAFAGNVIN
jgi:hypothetical protein